MVDLATNSAECSQTFSKSRSRFRPALLITMALDKKICRPLSNWLTFVRLLDRIRYFSRKETRHDRKNSLCRSAGRSAGVHSPPIVAGPETVHCCGRTLGDRGYLFARRGAPARRIPRCPIGDDVGASVGRLCADQRLSQLGGLVSLGKARPDRQE